MYLRKYNVLEYLYSLLIEFSAGQQERTHGENLVEEKKSH